MQYPHNHEILLVHQHTLTRSLCPGINLCGTHQMVTVTSAISSTLTALLLVARYVGISSCKSFMRATTSSTRQPEHRVLYLMYSLFITNFLYLNIQKDQKEITILKTAYVLENLKPNTFYDVKLAARSIIDIGASTQTLSIKTRQAGKYSLLYFDIHFFKFFSVD